MKAHLHLFASVLAAWTLTACGRRVKIVALIR